jgi:peptidoglycan/LPS O-acetylase OafA/YrhL
MLVFGQTALSFYLLHAHLLEFGASVLGVSHRLGLTATFIASIIVAVLPYPACLWYRNYKSARFQGWTQYV